MPDPRSALPPIRREPEGRPASPLRVMVATDPHRPLRTFVIPRQGPIVFAAVMAGITLVAISATGLALCLGMDLRALERRIGAMVAAAEDVAHSPVPEGARGDGRALMALAAGPRTRARSAAGARGTGRLEIESVNTGERVEVAIDLGTGEPDPDSYRKLRRVMRCLRTGAETPLDPRLIELLFRISQRTGGKVQLVSGFRAPMFSKADLSYHTRGMAADIRLPGMTPLMVRDLAVSMGVKGVGYYPMSQFVHVDVRDEKYYWVDHGRDRADDEGQEHGAGAQAAPAEAQ